MRDGSVAKDISMVVNPRRLLSRLYREGLHGHSLSLPLHFPSGTRLAMNSDVLFSLHALIMSMLHGRLFGSVEKVDVAPDPKRTGPASGSKALFGRLPLLCMTYDTIASQ